LFIDNKHENNDRKEALKYIFDYLSSVNTKAYKDRDLICNEVLSKNPYSSDFINNILRKNQVNKIAMYEFAKNLLIYYVKSFGYLLKYFIEKIIFSLYNYKIVEDKNLKDDIIIIDTFLLTDDVLKQKKYTEKFFVGFEQLLKKYNKNYLLSPVLVNSPSLCNYGRLLKYSEIKKNKIIFEHQLLSYYDYFQLLVFMIKYPIKLLSFIFHLKDGTFIENHLKNELLITIRYVSMQSYSRYLQGRQLAKRFNNGGKLISWYENQVIDKNLYRGIKEVNPKIKIIGSRPYIFTDEMLNEVPDETEKPFLTLPDKIVVNGKMQIPHQTKLKYEIAPSFRYKRLFESKISFKNRTKILVLLTIFDHEIKHILKSVECLLKTDYEILVKFHPDTTNSNYHYLLKDRIKIVEDNIYDLFNVTKIVIGISTGSLIEAACLAIPTIIIPHPTKYSLLFFKNYGKGIIWDQVDYYNSLTDLVAKFDRSVKEKQSELIESSKLCRSLYLRKYDETEIRKAYGLG